MADLIRESVDVLLAQSQAQEVEGRRERAARAAGRFRSGARDLATEHDRHLGDAYGR